MFGSAKVFLSGLVVAAGLAGCSSHGAVTITRAEVVKTYSQNLAHGYSDAVDDENAFRDVVRIFLDTPTEGTLTDSRRSWPAPRAHYMLTEAHASTTARSTSTRRTEKL